MFSINSLILLYMQDFNCLRFKYYIFLGVVCMYLYNDHIFIFTGNDWKSVRMAQVMPVVVRRFFYCNERRELSNTHTTIGARCNLERGIDPMRAKRAQESTESSFAFPFR